MECPILSKCLVAFLILMPSELTASLMTTREGIERVKSATVYIVCETREGLGSGSGFLISKEGLILTNNHVIEGHLSDPRVRFFSGSAQSQVYSCEVILVDTEYDLAILRPRDFHGEVNFFLPILPQDDLFETQALWVFGFPLGDKLGSGANGPAVSVNRGAVTALRKVDSGELDYIQHDASLIHGNSGGPIVDENGKLMGVVVSGILGVNINQAIPMWKLQAMVAPRVASVDFRKQASGLVDVTVEVEERGQRLEELWCEVRPFWKDGQGGRFLLKRANGSEYVGGFVMEADWRVVGLKISNSANDGKIREFATRYPVRYDAGIAENWIADQNWVRKGRAWHQFGEMQKEGLLPYKFPYNGDFRISADVIAVRGASNSAGFVFNFMDAENFYMAYYKPEQRRVGFYQKSNGQWVSLGFSDGGINDRRARLSLERIGSKMTISNMTNSFTVELEMANEGKLGLRTWGTTALFNNVEVEFSDPGLD